MIHAAAAAAARAAAKAIEEYCFRRLVDDYIARTVAAAPPWSPGLTMSDDCVTPYSEL